MMMVRLFIISLPIWCTLVGVHGKTPSKNLPEYFPHCHRKDPKISECLLKATEQVKPYLVKGVPELKFPKIEPFGIPEITLQQGTRALNFKAVLKNTTVHGLSNYKFSKFDFDVPNLQFYCAARISPLRLEGNYKVTGQVLLAPIVGDGKFVADIDEIFVNTDQKVKIIERKGVKYANPILTNSTIRVSGPKVKLDGLFGGNEEFARTTNKVINDNINELFEEIRPVIEEIVTNIIENLLFKTLMDNIPWDNLYPNIP